MFMEVDVSNTECFVLLSPFTLEYSHDLMQKKQAKTFNQDMLMSLQSADFSLDDW